MSGIPKSNLQTDMVKWVAEQFGGPPDPEARAKKLMDEMEELRSALFAGYPEPEILDEVADVYLCLLAYADSKGLSLDQLGWLKLRENKDGRTWEQQADGTWQHVETKAKSNGWKEAVVYEP